MTTQLHPRSHRTALAIATATAALLLTACGGGEDSRAADPGAQDQDLAAAQADSGVPEACLGAFPVAMGAPDLDDVEMLPADWPAAPADATLCQVSSTADGSIATVDYATTQDATAALDAWETALAAYSPARGDEGAGEQLTGTADGVAFEVTTRPGAVTVVLARP